MTTQPSSRRLAPLAAAVALCISGTLPAATIAVSTGNLTHFPTNCTLQDAVISINQGSIRGGSSCSYTGTFGDHDTVLLKDYVFNFSTSTSGGSISGPSALVMTRPMTLIGNLDGNGKPLATILRDSSTSNFRLIQTDSDLTLIGVSVKNGVSDGSAGAGVTGGGIRAENTNGPITLTLMNSVVSGNTAVGNVNSISRGGGIYANGANVVLENSSVGNYGLYTHGNSADSGGGIDVIGGNLIVTASTISGNRANDGHGGGILTTGTATLTNSTISGNYATGGGGGVEANRVNLTFCTFSGNATDYGNPGGGILIQADSVAHATLMYGNDPGNDVDGAVEGLSLDGDYDLIGSVGANVTAPRDRLTCDPDLAALADNGGGTQTVALSSGSCAVDAGPVAAGVLTSDQRGALFERRSGAATDIGAFEMQPSGDRIFYDGFDH